MANIIAAVEIEEALRELLEDLTDEQKEILGEKLELSASSVNRLIEQISDVITIKSPITLP